MNNILDHVVIVYNNETKEYFFSDKHTAYGLKGFVPVTHCFPCKVAPRKGLESGLIRSVEDVVFIFCEDYTNITDSFKVLDAITDPKNSKL